jgi:hypothetical protein
MTTSYGAPVHASTPGSADDRDGVPGIGATRGVPDVAADGESGTGWGTPGAKVIIPLLALT